MEVLKNEQRVTKTKLEEIALTLEKAVSGQITNADECFAKLVIGYPDPNIVNLYGLFLQKFGILKEAEKTFKRAEEIAKRANQKLLVGISHGDLGNLYMASGDYKAAERAYKESLAVHEEAGDKKGMASDYGNLGLLYDNMMRRDYKVAKRMFEKSLKLFVSVDDKRMIRKLRLLMDDLEHPRTKE
jgi:tetratricopeptide (TPR) repeat protein